MARRIVITGGFGALGSEVARRAEAAGWRVAVVDAGPSAPADLGLGAGAILVPGADLGAPEAAGVAIETARAGLGGLDALINIAGTFRWETVADGDPKTWDFLHRVNVMTALNASRAALPALIASGSGRIVNIGANGALKAGAGMGPYAASKAGVHRLTEALAEEMKDKGITVNAVLPSIIDTAMNRKDMPDADFSKWVAPSELAAIILFLASAEASAVTGALIPVMGRV